MTKLIVWSFLLVINTAFGIQDVRINKPTDWRVALTWFAVGVSALNWIVALKVLF